MTAPVAIPRKTPGRARAAGEIEAIPFANASVDPTRAVTAAAADSAADPMTPMVRAVWSRFITMSFAALDQSDRARNPERRRK